MDLFAKQKNVIVSIKGQQYIPEYDDTTSIELVTYGKLAGEGSNYEITYTEAELTGLEGALTTLLINDGQVTMMRTGDVRTHMVFEAGRKHQSLYDTEDGAMMVAVNAKRVDANVHESGGNIEMEYTLEIDNFVAGENNIKIEIRESGEEFAPPSLPRAFVYDQFIN